MELGWSGIGILLDTKTFNLWTASEKKTSFCAAYLAIVNWTCSSDLQVHSPLSYINLFVRNSLCVQWLWEFGWKELQHQASSNLLG